MPVYESVYTGANKDPLVEAMNIPAYKLTDDNNPFVLEVGMIIKFSGSKEAQKIKLIVTANNQKQN